MVGLASTVIELNKEIRNESQTGQIHEGSIKMFSSLTEKFTSITISFKSLSNCEKHYFRITKHHRRNYYPGQCFQIS